MSRSLAVVMPGLTISLLAGCLSTSRSPVAEQTLTGTAASRLDEFVEGGWRFQLGETIAEIERNLGEPVAVDTTVVANRHRPEVRDTVYTLEYEGLAARIYKVTLSGKQILTHLTITDRKYRMMWDLGVGASADRVIRVLGEPGEGTADTLDYQGSPPAENQVLFFLRDGIVEKVEWRFYID